MVLWSFAAFAADAPPTSKELVSQDSATRESALAQFQQQQKATGREFDLADKAEVFQSLTGLNSANYVRRAAAWLGTLREDPQIIQSIEALLQRGEVAEVPMAAALGYLESARPQRLSSCLESVDYGKLPGSIPALFATAPAMIVLREKYEAGLIDKFLSWKPGSSPDSANPFERAIVAEGSRAVPAFVKRFDLRTNVALPIAVVWLLGQIGTPEAFELVLAEHLRHPSLRTAITVGSCLGPNEVRALFRTFAANEAGRRELLAPLLGARWQEVSGKAAAEIEQFILKRLPAIISDCKARSVPQAG